MCNESDVIPLDTARYVYFYGLSVILPVGLLCNLLCFGVFLTSRSMRRTTTAHYLMALAVADTIFLVGEILRWLNSFDSSGQILGIDFMETVTFWCRTTFFLRYSGKLASAWITVVISAERFITVAYPLRVARISTLGIAKITIVCIYAACVSLGAFPYWTLGLKQLGNSTYCGYTDGGAYKTWSVAILMSGSLFVPSAFIFIFTTLILVVLWRARQQRRRQFEEEHDALNHHGGGASVAAAKKKKQVDVQLTSMLVSVALAFLVLRLPYTMTYYVNNHKSQLWSTLDLCTSHRIYLANKICDMIAIINYGVNLFLYCLCGSAFRNRLVGMLSRCGGAKHKNTGSSSSGTVHSRLSLSSIRDSLKFHRRK